MQQPFSRCIDALRGHPGLRSLNHGLEKEALRIDRYGYLSKKPHPHVLGSSLTHPSITTDFSEAQLEFVTGVHNSIESCMQEMEEVHRFVYSVLDGELLWPSSMPCMLRGESSIPLANYGSSNLGRFKQIYRQGLALRYGKYMQTISGMHYNFSISEPLWSVYSSIRGAQDSVEFRNQSYLELIRNAQRFAWLLVYLFGTSPAVCGSFLAGRTHNLEPFDGESFHLPYATSLRMGPLGYQSEVQSQYYVSYNSITDYIATMQPLLTDSYAPYQSIGLHSDSGAYQQLSDSVLQIEAESYSTVRPKPKARSPLRPLLALHQQGIDYLEVRCLDLNPFYSTGIDRTTLYFLDAFLLFAWLVRSPMDSQTSWEENQRNRTLVVERGRDPNLQLTLEGKKVSLIEYGHRILDKVGQLAELLDEANQVNKHEDAVAQQRKKLQDASKTPSALLLQQMAEWDKSYYRTIETLAKQHRDGLLSQPLSESTQKRFEKIGIHSHQLQQELELADNESFEDFLANYMNLSALK